MSPKTSAPGPGNEGGKPVSFNKGDAIRIASAVQKVERGDRGLGPSKLPRAVGGGGSSGFLQWGSSPGIAAAAETLLRTGG